MTDWGLIEGDTSFVGAPPPPAAALASDNFSFLCDLVKKNTGLVLTQEKEYLMITRLTPIMEKYGLSSLDVLANQLRGKLSMQMEKEVIEALCTYETFFFRDQKPFLYLQKIMMPHLIEKRQVLRQIRIWSAACSSGQEIYSIAMVLRQNFKQYLDTWMIRLLASDVSEHIVRKAAEGHYTQSEVQRGTPVQYLMSCFQEKENQWSVVDDIKRMIQFRVHNLLASPSMLGQFDIVFLRNVLIYFDVETKKKILEDIASVMEPESFLVMGTAESVFGVTDAFKPYPDQPGLFIKS